MKNLLKIILVLSCLVVLSGCQQDISDINIVEEIDSTTVINKDNEELDTELTEKETIETKVVTPEYGGTLRLSTTNPLTLNPFTNQDRDVDTVLKFIYEPLFRLSDEFEPTPVLASSYSINEDGKGLQITLKSGVVFSNEQPLVAQDIIYSYQQIKNNPLSIYAPNVAHIDRMVAVDDLTIQIYLDQVYGFALYDLTFPIASASTAKLSGFDAEVPIGTGPYLYSSHQAQKEIILSMNPIWHAKRSYLDEIKFIVAKNDEANEALYDQYLIDAISPRKFNWLKYSDGINNRIHEYVSLYYDFLAFSPTSPVFKQVTMRQAVAHAIDRVRMMEQIFLHHAIAVDTPIIPTAWYNQNEELVFDHNIEKALALKSKNEVAISLNPEIVFLVNSSQETQVKAAAFITPALEELGLVVNVLSLDALAYKTKLLAGEYDIALGGWKMSATPDFTPLFHSLYSTQDSNFIRHQSVNMDFALENMYKSYSQSAIIDSVALFQRTWLEELPYVSLYYLKGAVMTRQDVYGDFSPSVNFMFQGIDSIYLDLE